jgi:hypothetical protein
MRKGKLNNINKKPNFTLKTKNIDYEQTKKLEIFSEEKTIII